MNKNELLRKVREMKDITSDEKAYLIDLINTKKKYGLVWEDKPEDVEEQLRRELPVFKELKDKAIISDDAEAPNHILIEGDNLHALTALTYTHKGKVDVIYIDPPYNTGNNDFIYNDSYVDIEDTFRHSKWLSFIEKRIKLAFVLLEDSGTLFISIDDNEVAQLKLLCNEIFSEKNFVACLPTIMNLKGNNDQLGFAGTHEYTLVYAKNIQNVNFNELSIDDEELEKWSKDEYGFYKEGANLKATGVNAPRHKRPNLYFPLFISEDLNCLTYRSSEQDTEILPITKNEEMSWRWQKKKFQNESYNLIVKKNNESYSIYKKQRPTIGDLPSKKPKSVFYKPEYSSGNGTLVLRDILGSKLFNNPKPLNLIKDILQIGASKNSIILDFFAGSGTTLHAAMELNEEDEGIRQCILVTNNENNIAEEVTYERNKRVIEGYKNSKEEDVEGLTANTLRYYQTDFVPSSINEQNRRLLTERSTELICIKEDCYTDVTKEHKSIKPHLARIFTDRRGKYLVVIYHSVVQYEVIQKLIEIIPTLETEEKVKVYSFSPEKETIDEEFISIIDKIESVPLPESIYNTYKQCFRAIKLDRETAVEPEKTEDNVYLI